jgi:hypothetical protein
MNYLIHEAHKNAYIFKAGSVLESLQSYILLYPPILPPIQEPAHGRVMGLSSQD